MSRNSAGSSNQSHFARVPGPPIQRSTFDRSRRHPTTFNAGLLIPFFLEWILPGDSMKMNGKFLVRLATPIFPYMDNVQMDVHYFFVPSRLIWDNFEKFQGAQKNPGDSIDYLNPQLSAATHAAGWGELSIYDYFGLPTKVPSIVQADMPMSLPFRAYALVWNEWYRDENLQNSLDVPLDDGPDTFAYALQRRGRRKDYFTSGLPWPQKGPAVSIPVTGILPVTLNPASANPFLVKAASGHTLEAFGAALNSFTGTGSVNRFGSGTNAPLVLDPNGALQVDLASNINIAINQIRNSATLQQIFERDARVGTRYVEDLLGRWGVISPDFRLQRPEYLGGGTIPINVNPIAQTSQTDPDSPQGNLAAFAVGRGGVGFNHSFVEHGFVLGIGSVRADTTYQQGMNRQWSARTRYDGYLPELAHLGEQAVLNKEIFMASSTVQNNAVFCYQERWAELRYSPSFVTGLFRSNATLSLDSWHLALDFAALPTLAGIVQENPPIDRIVAVTTEPQFIMDSFFDVKHTRPLPTYSVPGIDII